jgi:hypothetical protein
MEGEPVLVLRSNQRDGSEGAKSVLWVYRRGLKLECMCAATNVGGSSIRPFVGGWIVRD